MYQYKVAKVKPAAKPMVMSVMIFLFKVPVIGAIAIIIVFVVAVRSSGGSSGGGGGKYMYRLR